MLTAASIHILIDYDNLTDLQKGSGILNVANRALFGMDIGPGEHARCEVRVYGGWYEGSSLSRKAQDVGNEIQRDFPYTIGITAGKGRRPVTMTAGLALSQLCEPARHLLDTFRLKGRPRTVRVLAKEAVECEDPDCPLPSLKELLKTGRCPKSGCVVGRDDLVYRKEQKIVDTMLACDLLFLRDDATVDRIALVSGDDDFLPPLRAVLLKGKSIVRFLTMTNARRAPRHDQEPTLIEKEL